DRQKGPGRARQGSVRAPQFAGGGTVHGPVPRSYEQRTPKKMKAAALRGALSDRAAHGRVHVVSSFTDGDQPRTKDALSVLIAACGVAPSAVPVLVVADSGDATTWKSLRNVPGVPSVAEGELNPCDVRRRAPAVCPGPAVGGFPGGPGAGPAAGGPAAESRPADAEPVAAETEPAETEATEPEDDES